MVGRGPLKPRIKVRILVPLFTNLCKSKLRIAGMAKLDNTRKPQDLVD